MPLVLLLTDDEGKFLHDLRSSLNETTYCLAGIQVPAVGRMVHWPQTHIEQTAPQPKAR